MLSLFIEEVVVDEFVMVDILLVFDVFIVFILLYDKGLFIGW